MKTSLLNSKKCSTAKRIAIGIALLPFYAAPGVAATSATPPTQASLVHDINANAQSNFQSVLEKWTANFGTMAIQPLLAIAKDHRNSDQQRYIAIMGAAKLGGPAIAEKLTPLLKDKIWLVRSATLKALAALRNPAVGKAVLPLLKDPALVVRAEAIETVKTLKPAGASDALIQVLQSQDNYRFGKAQWVPQRALAALVVIQDRSVVPQLRPLLDHKKDPELQRQTVFALQTLTGIDMDQKASLTAQVDTWKRILAGDGAPIVTSSAHSEAKPLKTSRKR